MKTAEYLTHQKRMTLAVKDAVTHYILSSHPKNKAIVDIKDKTSGDLRYIKIRHRLAKFYAVSLVDPVTFEVRAETQVKSANARNKPIVLHTAENKNSSDAKNDTSVEFRESSRLVFEWEFSWEGEKYKWARESRMNSILECKAVRKTGAICVAHYLPCILKDEYFGIFSLLGYNMLRCKLTKSRELELIILMSLMTLLDKSNDSGWKKDQISKGLQHDDFESYRNKDINKSTSNEDNVVLPIAYEDPIPKKPQQKKCKTELLNDQKLQLLLEKDVKRSQKQIWSDQRNHKPSISADNSPINSPLPTPSSSTGNFIRSSVLTCQKSASALNYNRDKSSTENSATETQLNSNGRLNKIFSSLSHLKHNNESSKPPCTYSSSTISLEKTRETNTDYGVSQSPSLKKSQQYYIHKQRSQKKQEPTDPTCYNHQMSLPIRYSTAQFTHDFGKLSIQLRGNQCQNPPSFLSIYWNPEPSIVPNKYIQQQQYTSSRVNRHPHVLSRRRLSSDSDHLLYSYHSNHFGNNYSGRYASNNKYFIHPYQQTNQFDYY